MGKSLEERVTKLEAQMAELLTHVQSDSKAVRKLQREVRKLNDGRETLESDVEGLKRDV